LSRVNEVDDVYEAKWIRWWCRHKSRRSGIFLLLSLPVRTANFWAGGEELVPFPRSGIYLSM
jgi:hypothetical protein